MTTRLYFLVPGEEAARKVTEAIRQQDVDDEHIYAVAKRDRYPLQEGIPEAGMLETSDVVNAAKRGAVAGSAVGLFGGLAVVASAPLGLIAAGGALLGATLAGATAGTWMASLVGTGVPNSDLQAFQEAIDQGQILMLVDVDDARAEAISSIVRVEHPQAIVGAGNLDA